MTQAGQIDVDKVQPAQSDRAFLPIPGPSPSDKVQFLEFSVAGRWSLSGTEDNVVLGKEGSAQLTRGGHTETGRYFMGAPDVLILTFPGSTPAEPPRNYEFIFRSEDVQNRILRFPTEGTH